MPGCVLRATGAKFDVDAFLSESPFRPATVYRKGQRRRPASRGTQTASGFNVVVSDTDDPPEKQIEYALTFLRDQQGEILRLVRFGGVEEIVLDFGIPQNEIATRSARFPADLLVAAGALGIDIHVSFYLVG
ncbi:MAG TPA: hypothetical protein VGA10_12135 [Thermoanaerobaculia bacterium]|jgi:hypothetical protein